MDDMHLAKQHRTLYITLNLAHGTGILLSIGFCDFEI